MAEENIKVNEATAPKERPNPTGNPNREPHGSASAPRDSGRKFGSKGGKPGERRGGRGGFHQEQKDLYEERVVDINRVSRTEKGGKHMRFDALVVIGDQKGKYGFALRKSGEVPDAIKKALAAARKNMQSIRLVKGTIAHEVIGTYATTRVVLKPAPAGTGIVAGGSVRAVVELAGIKNIVAKVYGSRTPINVIRATDAGLQSLKEYDKVMILRGKKTEEQIKAERAPKAPKAETKEEEK